MLNKNKLYLLISLEALFLGSLIIFTPSILVRQKNGISQVAFENILPLDNKHTYIQRFITDQDNLNSVSILLKNPALRSNDEVVVEILDQNQNTIENLNIFGQGIEDPGWIKFKFMPLNSKKNDNFYIKVTSTAKHDNDLYIYGNNQTKEINFRTTYKSTNLKQSFVETINFQKEKLISLNKVYLAFYIAIIFSLNLFLFTP